MGSCREPHMVSLSVANANGEADAAKTYVKRVVDEGAIVLTSRKDCAIIDEVRWAQDTTVSTI
jgi:hypothetical protein